MPANAEPLLFDADVHAYNTSDRPRAPAFAIEARAVDEPIATAVPTRTSAGVVSRYREANLISRALIFLPRYSGVRPTMRPATKTVMTARMSMPYNPDPTD